MSFSECPTIITLVVIGSIIFLCVLFNLLKSLLKSEEEEIKEEINYVSESSTSTHSKLNRDRKTVFSHKRLPNSNKKDNPVLRRGKIYYYIDNNGDEILVPKSVYDAENNSDFSFGGGGASGFWNTSSDSSSSSSSYDSSSDSGGCDGGGD